MDTHEFKLSELVRARNELTAHRMGSEARACHDQMRGFLAAINNNSAVDNTENLASTLVALDKAVKGIEREYSAILENVNRLIQEREQEYYSLSERIFEDSKHDDTPYILNREIIMSDGARENLYNTIRSLTDWQYPGLFIRPGRKDIIEEMVSSDPLYVADINIDLLTPTKERFNEAYQNRVLWRTLKTERQNALEFVPNDQLGTTFVMDFFEYMPVDQILRYTRDIFEKTRPGGKLLMTYNNCDIEQNVQMVEKKFRCYTPGNSLKNRMQEQGWNVYRMSNHPTSYCWLEAEKPGKLSTLRGGQSLGKIVFG